MSASLTQSFPTDGPYNVVTTLSVLGMGPGDPCLRIDEAGRVHYVIAGPDGPLALTIQVEGDELRVNVDGAEPEWLMPYLPDLLGLGYSPPTLSEPSQLKRLARKFAGLRLVRLPIIFPCLVRIVLQQLVSYRDAQAGWRTLVRRRGRAVEGHDGLFVPPAADVLARMAPFEFIECGILPEHGRRIRGLARLAKKIEATWAGGIAPEALDRTCELLLKQRGVGPWTTGYLRGVGMGDSDAIVLRDYGFPKRVSYFFTGEEEADDDDMLRLLEPYRPHRFYVLSLLIKGATPPPRRGPRRRPLRDRLRPPR